MTHQITAAHGRCDNMCIVLLTTAHPEYPIIILDNRDEFVIRPTSRPHWWQAEGSTQSILSSRDLQRREQGTWMGVTKSGNIAVLTNYKEDSTASQPIEGQRSRGGMVTAWLTAPEEESTNDFVKRLMAGEGVKGVGGFSLLCGKLRKVHGGEMVNVEPLAIISNRAGSVEDVPWIGGNHNEIHGLSNTFFDDPVEWPKVRKGKAMLANVIEESTTAKWSQKELISRLFEILDDDTLPVKKEGESFDEYTYQLRKSIFIPPFKPSKAKLPSADQIASAKPLATHANVTHKPIEENANASSTTPAQGVYGTQRQTLILVNKDGRVVFVERALWDDTGKPIEKGLADERFEFVLVGWE